MSRFEKEHIAIHHILAFFTKIWLKTLLKRNQPCCLHNHETSSVYFYKIFKENFRHCLKKREKMSSTPQNSGEKSKKASDKDVDLSNSARGVWLVKVPKYISERWETQSGGAQVGKLKIIKRSNMKPMVTLSLDDHLTKAMPDNKEVTQKTGKK